MVQDSAAAKLNASESLPRPGVQHADLQKFLACDSLPTPPQEFQGPPTQLAQEFCNDGMPKGLQQLFQEIKKIREDMNDVKACLFGDNGIGGRPTDIKGGRPAHGLVFSHYCVSCFTGELSSIQTCGNSEHRLEAMGSNSRRTVPRLALPLAPEGTPSESQANVSVSKDREKSIEEPPLQFDTPSLDTARSLSQYTSRYDGLSYIVRSRASIASSRNPSSLDLHAEHCNSSTLDSPRSPVQQFERRAKLPLGRTHGQMDLAQPPATPQFALDTGWSSVTDSAEQEADAEGRIEGEARAICEKCGCSCQGGNRVVAHRLSATFASVSTASHQTQPQQATQTSQGSSQSTNAASVSSNVSTSNDANFLTSSHEDIGSTSYHPLQSPPRTAGDGSPVSPRLSSGLMTDAAPPAQQLHRASTRVSCAQTQPRSIVDYASSIWSGSFEVRQARQTHVLNKGSRTLDRSLSAPAMIVRTSTFMYAGAAWQPHHQCNPHVAPRSARPMFTESPVGFFAPPIGPLHAAPSQLLVAARYASSPTVPPHIGGMPTSLAQPAGSSPTGRGSPQVRSTTPSATLTVPRRPIRMPAPPPASVAAHSAPLQMSARKLPAAPLAA